MEYAALTFWMAVIVFTALGVHKIWSSLVQPKVVNSILLPGTLVAQLGYVLGLLITGGTVDNTALIKDDDSGEPQTGKDSKTQVPIVGTIVIALLPMVGCAVAIGVVSGYWGTGILAEMATSSDRKLGLPSSLPLFFSMLHGCIDLVQRLLNVLQRSNLSDWRTVLFLYLVVCLTVRMAPLTGNIRGALGALLIFGVLAFLLGQISPATTESLSGAWPLITFCVAVLLLLLMVSLIIKGGVGLIRILSHQG